MLVVCARSCDLAIVLVALAGTVPATLHRVLITPFQINHQLGSLLLQQAIFRVPLNGPARK